MSSRPRAPRSESRSSGRRTGRGSAPRVNRAQQRAMEVRAAATRSRVLAEEEEVENQSVIPFVSSGAGAAAAGAKHGRRRPARTAVLSREQEYRFIHEDMVRLILTASVLLVVMLAILIVVEG